MKCKFFFFIILVAIKSFAFAKETQVEVSLSTGSSLIPIYIAVTFQEAQKENFKELLDTLQFDLGQDGYFQTVQNDLSKEALYSQENRKIYDFTFWQNFLAQYVVHLDFSSKGLSATLIALKAKQFKHYEKISFSHDSLVDRKKIHQLADKILWDVTKKKGIATSRLLFSQKVPNPSLSGAKWISEIWMCDYDGKNLKQMTFDQSYAVHPLFIPPPKKPKKNPDAMLYVSYRTGQPKIYRKNFNASVAQALITLPGNQLLPAISVGGDFLTFISDVAGRPDLFLQYLSRGEPSGKPRQLFSFPRATQASSTFSPDTKKVAFVSDKDGSPRIYVVNLFNDKENKRPSATLMTKIYRQNVSPAWSPDGKYIAYSGIIDGVRQICIYDIQKEKEWQLTEGPEHKENPAWASDSFHLVYNSEDKNSTELYLINLQKKEPIQISHGFGKKRFPCWEPL